MNAGSISTPASSSVKVCSGIVVAVSRHWSADFLSAVVSTRIATEPHRDR